MKEDPPKMTLTMANVELQDMKDVTSNASTEANPHKGNLMNRFISSFDPHPNYRPPNQKNESNVDVETGNIKIAESPLARRLKGRHLQMIAIGGSIGTGLFVGSGNALKAGGPAALLIAFGLIGMMLYCVVHALGELAVVFPVAGSFAAYSTRFLDPAWGFAMGWK